LLYISFEFASAFCIQIKKKFTNGCKNTTLWSPTKVRWLLFWTLIWQGWIFKTNTGGIFGRRKFELSSTFPLLHRLWHSHGQAALESSHVCLLNGSATGTEILKNLILPGKVFISEIFGVGTASFFSFSFFVVLMFSFFHLWTNSLYFSFWGKPVLLTILNFLPRNWCLYSHWWGNSKGSRCWKQFLSYTKINWPI